MDGIRSVFLQEIKKKPTRGMPRISELSAILIVSFDAQVSAYVGEGLCLNVSKSEKLQKKENDH